MVLLPGDSLWSAAASGLARVGVPEPTEPEIARYWVAVVAANRERLPNPADPSFVLPGFEVVLPPPAL